LLDLDASERADRYVKFIEEIKERFEVIALFEQSGSVGVDVLPEPFALETCYLQIRLICELIALACLVGHGPGLGNDVDPLTKTYKPHEIMRGLAALKPDFFPKQLRWTVQNKDDGTADMTLEPTEVLTADDVVALHGKMGNILHRGRLSRILEAKEHPRSFQDVRGTCERLMRLLGRHTFMVAPDKLIWVEMFTQPGNRVTWLEATFG
jgi:hypothetical protein